MAGCLTFAGATRTLFIVLYSFVLTLGLGCFFAGLFPTALCPRYKRDIYRFPAMCTRPGPAFATERRVYVRAC